MKDNIVCPRCDSESLYKHGKTGSGKTRWHCKHCDHRTANPKEMESGRVYQVTEQTGPDGEVKNKWTRYKYDDQKRMQIVENIFKEMAEDVPRVDPITPPSETSRALCNLYTLTDCHMGMLAWHEETGEDWDLKIAERVLFSSFEEMINRSPDASVAVINQLGDWLHSDGLLPVTPTSGHVLDQDSRFSKIVSSTVKLLRRMVDLALAKHEQVHVIMAEGNHDISSSVWLRHLFSALYENEPRVTVDKSPLPYYAYRHGEVMLSFHHGHLKKNADLPGTIASVFDKMWGVTNKRYCHVGHWHHQRVLEVPGITLIQHPTLAAKDAFAARSGYMSLRRATAITYHEKYGEVATNSVTPDMFI